MIDNHPQPPREMSAKGKTMKIISLGWGVQSFTLAAMSALGELEPVDFAIHADTGHESQLTYEFAARWTPWFEEHNLSIKTVKNPIANMGELFYKGQTHIPAFTKSVSDGDGQLNRSCTQRWKIAPMRRAIRLVAPKGASIEQWIGISLDEFQRMKDSDVKYITHRWPLIEKRMTRADCVEWLEANGLEVPPKSACTFCPFHDTAEWRRIQGNAVDWAEAVKIDHDIRLVRPGYETYIHPSRRPLEKVDLRTEQERGQLSLWDAECSGICGV